MAVEHIWPNSADVREISAQLAHLNSIEAARAAQEGASLPSVYWNEVKEIAESGEAKRHFAVGHQFVDKYTDPDNNTPTVYSNPWDIMDFRNVRLHDGEDVPAIIIGTHYTHLVSMQFSGRQALIYAPAGLPAGTYTFNIASAWSKLVVGNYQFTLTQALPAGGQLVGVWRWPDVEINTWTLDSYASATATTKIETVSVISGNSGTALGTILPIVDQDVTVTVGGTSYALKVNGYQQAAYGNNRWKYSAVRQYLNSDANAGEWWTPQTVFDRAPDVATTKKGWLAGVPDEFKQILTPVKVKTAVPTAIGTGDEDEFDVTYDKVFLPSLNEHYISPQDAGEGDPWEYWKEINGTATKWPTGVNTDALKVATLANHNTTTYRWLRSAYRGLGSYAWFVYPAGYVSYYGAAANSLPLAPACAIC